MPDVWRYTTNITDERGFPCVVDQNDISICFVSDDGLHVGQESEELWARRGHMLAAAPSLYALVLAAWASFAMDKNEAWVSACDSILAQAEGR